MELEYAYCPTCGAEYTTDTYFDYEMTTPNGRVVKCLECESLMIVAWSEEYAESEWE